MNVLITTCMYVCKMWAINIINFKAGTMTVTDLPAITRVKPKAKLVHIAFTIL